MSETGIRRTLMLAPHYKAATTHAQELRLGAEGRDWRFISDASSIRGISPEGYAVVACQLCSQHPRAAEIEQALTIAGLPMGSWTWLEC